MNNKPSQDDVSLPELNKMAALQPDENFRWQKKNINRIIELLPVLGKAF